MISSVGFVPSGVLKSKPLRQVVSEEDLQRLKSRLESTMHQPQNSSDGSELVEESCPDDDDVMTDKEAKQKNTSAIEHAKEAAKQVLGDEAMSKEGNEMAKELRLDEYDDQEEIDGTSFLDNIVSSMPDEYSIAKEDVSNEELSDEEETSSDDDLEIQDTDLVILTTKADEILSSVEVWLYEEADDEEEGSLIVHHDFPLPFYPLCCEYLDLKPGDSSHCNLVAVGGMKVDVEIYDLDLWDPISPLVTLDTSSEKKSQTSTHAMASNGKFRNVLASGCDDKRVRIWDISQGVMTSSLKLHKSSIQSISWNPQEDCILLSGGHDKKCSLIDVRVSDGEVLKWKLNEANEDIAWCGHQPTSFIASDESGEVAMFDARNGAQSNAIFRLAAHKESTTVVSVSPLCALLFMTGSEDGKVKIWHINGAEVELVEKKNLGVGEVLAGGFCKFGGYLVTAAGEKGTLKVWDTKVSPNIRKYYPQTLTIPKSLIS